MKGTGDDFRRRASDTGTTDEHEILSLIRQATNDESKGHLIILYKMATLLNETVSRLEILEEATTRHATMVVKAGGAWRAMAFGMGAFVLLFSIIGSLAGYIWLGTTRDIRTLSDDVKALTHAFAEKQGEQDSRLGRLETNTPISREADKRLTIIENNMKDTIGSQLDYRQRLGELERAFGRVLEQRAKGK